MKWNLKEIMTKAWEIYRKPYLKCGTFAEALHRAWLVAKFAEENNATINDAIAKSGISERVRTWYGWTLEGREVVHESKCLFQVTIKDGTRGDGKTKVLSYFGESQTAVKVA